MVVEGTGELRHVVVVGGGITGLAAACALRDGSGVGTGAGPVRVTVLEASGQIGGKLRVGEVGRRRRRRRCGVAAAAPAGGGRARPRGRARRRPGGRRDHVGDRLDARRAAAAARRRTVMGMPGDLRALAPAGLLTARELARVPLDSLAAAHPDRGRTCRSAATSRDRLGRAVVDRLVEPLLGGVYAGRADDLSLDATMPAAGAARAPPALAARCRASEPGSLDAAAGSAVDGAVFAGTARRRRPAAGRRGRGVGGRRCDRRHRPRAAPHARAAGGWCSARRGRRGAARPTPWCSPSRPRPAARLLRRTLPPRPPSWPGSRTPRWPWSPSPSPARRSRGRCTGPASWCRRSTAGRSRRRPSPRTKWGWYAGAAPGLRVRPGLASAGSARRPCCSATTPTWSTLALADLADALGRHRAAARRPGHPLGRRPAAVRRRPPRPGRADPRGRRGAPGPRRVRRGVRRGRHPRLRGDPRRACRRRRCCDNGRHDAPWQPVSHAPKPKARDLNAGHPLHDVVGVPAARTAARATAPAVAAEVDDAVRPARRQGRRRPRHLRRAPGCAPTPT